MRNVQLVLCYDGTDYCGWERQREFRSVQQVVEQAIGSLTGESPSVIASGRTDAGVHAIGQVANFRTQSRHDCATIQRALNALLPPDVRVRSATDVADTFHATYAARGKLYRYVVCDGPVMDPLLRRYALHSPKRLDDAAMDRAARCLVGRHDFSSFESAGSPRQSSVRTITHIAVFRAGPQRIWCGAARGGDAVDASSSAADLSLVFLEVAADGFLYNMVRAIAGTLIQVGRGYWPVARVEQVLASQDRTQAGPTAPSHGLFLVRVDY